MADDFLYVAVTIEITRYDGPILISFVAFIMRSRRLRDASILVGLPRVTMYAHFIRFYLPHLQMTDTHDHLFVESATASRFERTEDFLRRLNRACE